MGGIGLENVERISVNEGLMRWNKSEFIASMSDERIDIARS
jgi:hypothetical protein